MPADLPADVPADPPADLPADLRAALDDYERALAADDLPALDDAFADEPTTLRGDAAGLLVGADAIRAFRGTRGGVAPRTTRRLEARRLADDCWLLVSVHAYDGGGSGLQTQVWRRDPDRWRVVAAHVTGRTRAFDRTVWRTVGDPMYQGAYDGPLRGLRVAVKDVVAVKGYRVGAGNPTWLDGATPERHHAPAVLDLLQGGASVRGIARTDELAYSVAGDNPHHGTPPNGALPGALPGGSTSGPASAVATGQADVGLGTDTAGSLRVPASYQGLWGLRTTHGLVPRQGVLPLAPSFDTVGWLARDGATLERVVRWCLADGDDAAPGDGSTDGSTDGAGTRLVVPVEAVEACDPGTAEAFRAWLRTAAAALPGCTLAEASLGPLDAWAADFRTVQAAEAWRLHGAWVRAHPGALGAAVAGRFATAAQVTPAQERAARERLDGLRARVRALVADAVLVLPTTPGPAPARTLDPAALDAVRAATLRLTAPAAVGRLPALSVPLLTVPSPLGPAPVGVCLVGAPRTDLALVALGRRLAAATAVPARAAAAATAAAAPADRTTTGGPR
ncbi:AtzH-like domain-containing protein [Cellulomonas shaoxiangyii]|uniref:AtzH-like domain-containing protein n=1 Tax=Cellulomonas shaoxiangyii TaxID=2566013 RepID=UPI001FC9B9BF|nr:AtzH-like domain-containing protein [Cellulomonas shaoxiangyii]